MTTTRKNAAAKNTTRKNTTATNRFVYDLAAALDAARDSLGLDTLQTRGRDALDFHDMGVAGIRTALIAAFEAGVEHARKNAR